ncbi:ORF6N domain-containing protein, partial [Clostridioides difficile]
IEGGFGEGKKCITDKTISEIHNMEIKHVRELINRNIRRFINAIDFIDLKVVVDNDYNLEVLELLSYRKMQISKANNIYLLSERGYSKLIKIMDT